MISYFLLVRDWSSDNDFSGPVIFCINLDCSLSRLFLYKKHFYKQHQAEIGKKLSKSKADTLRLNF